MSFLAFLAAYCCGADFLLAFAVGLAFGGSVPLALFILALWFCTRSIR